MASEYGRYGYLRITALLQQAGCNVGRDRVQRIWRREGMKVPAKKKPRRRLWLNDGSCIRLRPQKPNHVWSYDFVEARTHDGRSLRLLTMIDEYTRQCLAIRMARRLNSYHVIETLGDCLRRHGYRPAHIHFLIGADGYRELVTALYFRNDDHIDSDTVFGVTKSLVTETRSNDPSSPFPDLPSLRFDFTLGARTTSEASGRVGADPSQITKSPALTSH